MHWTDSVFVWTLSCLNRLLLEWISEYAVRTYTTPDSTVTYLNHAQSHRLLHGRLLRDARLQPNVMKTVRFNINEKKWFNTTACPKRINLQFSSNNFCSKLPNYDLQSGHHFPASLNCVFLAPVCHVSLLTARVNYTFGLCIRNLGGDYVAHTPLCRAGFSWWEASAQLLHN